MPGPESEIIATFVAQLKSTDEVPTAVADRLADLLSGDALPKPSRRPSAQAVHRHLHARKERHTNHASDERYTNRQERRRPTRSMAEGLHLRP